MARGLRFSFSALNNQKCNLRICNRLIDTTLYDEKSFNLLISRMIITLIMREPQFLINVYHRQPFILMCDLKYFLYLSIYYLH